jgi:hypothetical protein
MHILYKFSKIEYKNLPDTIKVTMKSGIIKLLLILFSISFFIQCQHARVRLIPDIPNECKPWSEKEFKEVCQDALQSIRNNLSKKKTTVKDYSQAYLYWGLRPKTIPIDLTKECPKGVYEIYQFSSFKNVIYEQLTIGFYSPRTLRLTCYE